MSNYDDTMALFFTSVLVGLAIIFAITVLPRLGTPRRLPLPPGPKGIPLLGNVNDLPKPGVLEAHHWLRHKDLYGPISSVTVMGQTLIILNDPKLGFELLEKRSAKHSSRPKQVFAGEMVGWENSLGLSPYNTRFRTYRKNLARIIGSKALASQFNELLEAEVGHFLIHVLEKPGALLQHIRREAGAVILKIAYGYVAEPHGSDPLINMAGDAMEKFARAAVPGAFMVDIAPFLQHLPDWLPGTRFKQTARQWRASLNEVTEKPYSFVKDQLAQGIHNKSFLSQLLAEGDAEGEQRFTNKWSAMSLYTAGADTTVSSMTCFFLAMTLFPDAQKKAQDEIDRVIGYRRLPTLADRSNLPYINAVVKEVLRWHPVVPMGLPHTSTEDDVYEGLFIPKGSMIFANIWHFTHDPCVYSDPMVFKPERFIETNDHLAEPNPHDFVFGFGRRVCPGRILADNALYLNISQSLSVFNISKAIKNGEEMTPDVLFEPGVISHPVSFQNSVKPRSVHHKNLILSIEKTHPWLESNGQTLKNMSS